MRFPLVLASGSPRRALMLRDAGFAPIVEPADIDDASVMLETDSIADLTLALALFKVRRVDAARRARGAASAVILGADTMCALDGELIGKPRDEAHAESMLRAFEQRPHEVVTAWCILAPDGTRVLESDLAIVHVGALTDAQRTQHLTSGAWRGKAGGYNFPEAVAAGWPVTCDGLWETVVGLPLVRFAVVLEATLRAGSVPRMRVKGGAA
ncbi:MAG: hypothetical protein EXS10_00375 [Phycisphaerales bacterium]|nr:hypothetical protein [Phycisphaerales bacterium]